MRCPICGGTGRLKCAACNGTGRLLQEDSLSSLFYVGPESYGGSSCYECDGQGYEVCYTCKGNGVITTK